MNALAQIAGNVSTASLDYSVFKKAVLNACRVVEKKNTIPVLDTFLMFATRNGVQVAGTDLDLYTTTFVPGTVDRDFVALVDAHKLRGVMDKVKDAGTINFSQDGDSLAVSIGKVRLTLKQDIPRADFPEEMAFRDGLKRSNASFHMPSATLAKLLQKVRFAISTEETRYYLNGVFMHVNEYRKRLTFVTTDGHRLARYELPVPSGAGAMPDDGVIIPRKTVEELYRLVSRKGCPTDVMVTVTEAGVSFLIGEDELIESKVIDGTFPDYQRVIPTANEHKIAVHTNPFIEALKQASSIMTEKSRSAKLTLTPGRLQITCKDVDFGAASTEVMVFHDTTLEIGFNSTYLAAILAQLDGGTMLELGGAGDPVIVKDGADECVTYVLMPLRV